MLSSRNRSGGGATVADRHEAAINIVLASDDELEHEIVVHQPAVNLSVTKAALVKPGGHGNDLPSEPQSRHQAMESPELEC